MDKPDTEPKIEQLEEIQKVRAFFDRYGTALSVALGAVVIVVGAAMLWQHRTRARLERASVALTSAKSIQDVEALIGQYGGTPVAPLAMLKLAKLHYNNGEYDMAAKAYADFFSQYPEHSFAAGAELGQTSCLEAKGQTESALQGYQAFAAKYPGHYLTPEAVFGAGRCLQHLGRLPEAKVLYEDFVTAHPDSPAQRRAEEQLDLVNQKIEEQRAGPPAAVPSE